MTGKGGRFLLWQLLVLQLHIGSPYVCGRQFLDFSPNFSHFVQTYGSKNVKRVGTILQRGILILLLFCFPCWALFINTEQILLFFRQDPEVSRSGGAGFMDALHPLEVCGGMKLVFG